MRRFFRRQNRSITFAVLLLPTLSMWRWVVSPETSWKNTLIIYFVLMACYHFLDIPRARYERRRAAQLNAFPYAFYYIEKMLGDKIGRRLVVAECTNGLLVRQLIVGQLGWISPNKTLRQVGEAHFIDPETVLSSAWSPLTPLAIYVAMGPSGREERYALLFGRETWLTLRPVLADGAHDQELPAHYLGVVDYTPLMKY